MSERLLSVHFSISITYQYFWPKVFQRGHGRLNLKPAFKKVIKIVCTGFEVTCCLWMF